MAIDGDALKKYLKLVKERNSIIKELDTMQLRVDRAKDELNKETYNEIWAHSLAHDVMYFPTNLSFTIHADNGKPFWYSSTTDKKLYDRMEKHFYKIKQPKL